MVERLHRLGATRGRPRSAANRNSGLSGDGAARPGRAGGADRTAHFCRLGKRGLLLHLSLHAPAPGGDGAGRRASGVPSGAAGGARLRQLSQLPQCVELRHSAEGGWDAGGVSPDPATVRPVPRAAAPRLPAWIARRHDGVLGLEPRRPGAEHLHRLPRSPRPGLPAGPSGFPAPGPGRPPATRSRPAAWRPRT